MSAKAFPEGDMQITGNAIETAKEKAQDIGPLRMIHIKDRDLPSLFLQPCNARL